MDDPPITSDHTRWLREPGAEMAHYIPPNGPAALCGKQAPTWTAIAGAGCRVALCLPCTERETEALAAGL